MPPDVNVYDNTLMEAAEALALRWHEADPERMGALPSPVSASDVEGWAPDTLCAFASKLGQVTTDQSLTKAATRTIGTIYNLDAIRNPEVLFLGLLSLSVVPLSPESTSCVDAGLWHSQTEQSVPACSNRPRCTGGLARILPLQVRMAWLKVCIAAEDDAALEDALQFAKEQGRMKFARPLYKALYGSSMGRDRALSQFQLLQDTYHPIARKMIAADLQVH